METKPDLERVPRTGEEMVRIIIEFYTGDVTESKDMSGKVDRNASVETKSQVGESAPGHDSFVDAGSETRKETRDEVLPRDSQQTDSPVHFVGFEDYVVLDKCNRSSESEPERFEPYRAIVRQKINAYVDQLFLKP